MSKHTSQAGLVDNLLIGELRESLRRCLRPWPRRARRLLVRVAHRRRPARPLRTVRPQRSAVRRMRQHPVHFVVWLEHDGALLADADDAQFQRFARHSCECAGFAHRKWPAPTPRLSAHGAVRFVRFLEARGLVRHPGEVAEGFRLAEAFARSVRAQGFQPSTADTYRRTFTHFVVWLHQCRTPLDRSMPAWRRVLPPTTACAWDRRGVLQSSRCAAAGGSRPELLASRTSGPAAMPGQENLCASPRHRTRAWSRSGSGCCGSVASRSAASTCTRASCVRC